jgi:hypothetical protein
MMAAKMRSVNDRWDIGDWFQEERGARQNSEREKASSTGNSCLIMAIVFVIPASSAGSFALALV